MMYYHIKFDSGLEYIYAPECINIDIIKEKYIKYVSLVSITNEKIIYELDRRRGMSLTEIKLLGELCL